MTDRLQFQFNRASVCLVLLVALVPAGAPAENAAPLGIALIPSGIYRPLLRGEKDAKEVPVEAFALDVCPVTNDAGQSVKLGTLQGRVQVVAMFFASCTCACPIIVHDMKRTESALPETLRTNTGLTLITIDTKRHTPEALHAYRAAHKLPADRWTLLHGTTDDTLELAALLGVKFKREANGIVSRTLLNTPETRVVLFGFATGQELTEHTSTRRALINILSGRCEFSLDGQWHSLEAGAWVHMPPNTPHAVKAMESFSMLLTLVPPGGVAANPASR